MRLLKTLTLAAMLALVPATSHAKDKKLAQTTIVEMADISVGISGLVCDFCSIALNKTFKKRKAVRATYVDLDAKTLSVVLNDGEDISNEDVIELVKKAGYATTKITRKDGSEYIPPAKP